VPVLEIGLKSKGKIISRRKITTYKPTVFILGRQHANEVSSTNYGFNIAWLLAKDPGYRKYLQQLNIVIEPMENPDGSALAVELQKITPHHMLHAGRYSALGTDIGYHVNKPDTLITEAKVRKKLYDRWQPDIFLNNHGYPSHEWVQQFSNYTPYLFRAYWIPRGGTTFTAD
jgi:murein tripeptide amidase MpaA